MEATDLPVCLTSHSTSCRGVHHEVERNTLGALVTTMKTVEIPYDEMYVAYTKDRRMKGQPFMSREVFVNSLKDMAKKDKKGFLISLELSGWI